MLVGERGLVQMLDVWAPSVNECHHQTTLVALIESVQLLRLRSLVTLGRRRSRSPVHHPRSNRRSPTPRRQRPNLPRAGWRALLSDLRVQPSSVSISS